ncbi:diacylglycerol O-acyltransferase [Mycobacterium frederiksbergense]|uniref:diacylglycerol O-acyltransferase n=1 Tax=Mycolicibacterium frederiksbergense TaxID=117567 RepID=A0ABT6KVW5_9MYCO|nr:wax ester/triacylglycerol synthase domain-containing protein [Mycolicibacterium frederiksbergense]MDH6194000.1 diacylglycerol O-acyltransferase [Mycolicibacterium frederiksbergense]
MTDYLSSTDDFMWSLGFDPVLRSTIVTLTVLDHPVDWAVIVDRFDRISRVVPRFRQRVARSIPLSRPHWESVPDFDLKHHLHKLAVPEPRSLAVLLDLARLAVMGEFDRNRPLWRATLVDGLADESAALLCTFDHSLTDGIGAVQIASVLYDGLDSCHPAGILTPCTAAGVTRRGLAVRRHVHALTTGLSAAQSIYRAARPIRGPRSPIMRGRTPNRHVDILEVSRPRLQRAGRVAGGTLNDAFVAAVTGGIRLYHEYHRVPVGELMISMPISIRTPTDAAGGNRATLIRFPVPTGTTDPEQRIAEIHSRTTRARGEKSLGYTDLIAAGLNSLPRCYLGSELRHVDFIASDVPGFPAPLRLGDSPVRMQYAFSPTLGSSVNITLLSYVDTCAIGINVDTGAVPDHDTFHECLTAGFAETMGCA